jgi:hypothetical protein
MERTGWQALLERFLIYKIYKRLSCKDPRCCQCEERFLRRGNLEVLDILDYEFASLRSQSQQKKTFSSGLLIAR